MPSQARDSSLSTVSVSMSVPCETLGPAARSGLGGPGYSCRWAAAFPGARIRPARAISDGSWLLEYFLGAQLRRREGVNRTHAVEVLPVLEVFGQQNRTFGSLRGGHDERIPPGQAKPFLDLPGPSQHTCVDSDRLPLQVVRDDVAGSRGIQRGPTALLQGCAEFLQDLNAQATQASASEKPVPSIGQRLLGDVRRVVPVDENIRVNEDRAGHTVPPASVCGRQAI